MGVGGGCVGVGVCACMGGCVGCGCVGVLRARGYIKVCEGVPPPSYLNTGCSLVLL